VQLAVVIVTVTLNAALDVTYTIDTLTPRSTHRVRAVARRAGGKGINVARVLAALGEPTLVTGLAGGSTGAAIRQDLVAAGLADRLVPITAESRRTLTVVDGGGATGFHEPGGEVRPEEWAAFCSSFAELVQGADVVVCSGSLPPGVPTDAYAVLITLAAAHRVRTLIDAEGPPLREALRARPSLVKPNAAELAATVGATDPLSGAEALRWAGAEAAVVTLAADGLLAVAPDGAWQARPSRRLTGNATGAGDACAAALAAGLRRGSPWAESLRTAVALPAAAVRSPLAGDFDHDTYREISAGMNLEAMHAADCNERDRLRGPR
jgi:tagatose 6-phosphate kinase